MLPDLATSPILTQVSPVNGKTTHMFYHIPVDKQFNAAIKENNENALTNKSVTV